MSLARRIQMLRWAKTCGSVIFEDDYDGDFRYLGRPLPALSGMMDAGSVIYAGGFSKTLFPSLRISYVVLPESLVPHFSAALSMTSRYIGVFSQAILAEFLAEGHFGRHVLAMRRLYGERQELLLNLMRAKLAGALDVIPCEVGLNLFASTRPGVSPQYLAAAAVDEGTEVWPISSSIDAGQHSHGVLLGFAAFNEQQTKQGIDRLARALDKLGALQASGCRRGTWSDG